MAKGARYTGEFKEKAVRLPAEESRSLYSPGGERDSRGSKGSGDCSGITAMLSLSFVK